MPPGNFQPALRRITTPADENHQGTIFGGVILSLVDQAGYVEARRHGLHRWVTVTIDRVEFHAPVFTGDILQLATCTESTGRSSVTVRVVVEAERYDTGKVVKVTEAIVKMVAVGPDGRSIDFRQPPTSGHPPAAPGPSPGPTPGPTPGDPRGSRHAPGAPEGAA